MTSSRTTRRAFTMVEILITVVVIGVLAVFVVTLLNPTEYINRSKDSTRVSETQSINSAVALYARDNAGGLGTPGVTYLSLIDPNATTTAGTDCSGLGFPAGGTYHCAASSTARNVDGTGWIPVNLAKISGGSPLSQYPVDPVNSSSSGEYYEYATDGITWSLESFMQSDKYTANVANESSALSSSTYKVGTAKMPTMLYGATQNYLISINSVTGALANVHLMNSLNDGRFIGDSLIGYRGLLYGVTLTGGTHSDGTIFNFNPSTNTLTKLHDFNGTDGSSPSPSMVEYNGILYGVALQGGSSGDGDVYSFNPSTNGVNVLHSFGGSDGNEPAASLAVYDGVLYGTTALGGTHSDGVIFSINLSNNNQFTTLYDFGGADGKSPQSALVESGSLFYGMTSSGGDNNLGTIFTLNPSNNSFKKIYSFSTDGSGPEYNLISHEGLLFGTGNGGTYGYGVLFRFDPSSGTFTKLHDFSGGNSGKGPVGELISYGDMIYGLTAQGGTSNAGTAFSFDIENNTFSTLNSMSDGSVMSGLTQFAK